MKNEYLRNLNKIEFILTYACTGRCKHCFEGDHTDCTDRIDSKIAADAVRKIAAEYDIGTVMVFGGEPLLHTDALYAIINAARELEIPKRQVITNGYFSSNTEKIREVIARLSKCGVNDLLLSADAFHQQTIPLETVLDFASIVKEYAIPIRLQPAWLVSRDDDNPYNQRTREILDAFVPLGIDESEGNLIYPEGNALKYLGEYFEENAPKNPYTDDPCDVKCVSFEPNGGVLGANAYKTDIMEILEKYKP